MTQLVFDEKLSRQLESNYSRRDFQRRRRLVHEALDAQPGQRVLDVGCGPGFYVSELVDRVGKAGAVVGVDISADMLSLAKKRCEGHANVAFHEASATTLPVDDSSFDAALSVQVLEYVTEVDAALAEMSRILRPGGRLVLWDVDWSTVSWHSADPDRMTRVLRAWNEHLSHPALPRTLAARLKSAGFEGIAAEGYSFVTTEFTPESYGCSIMPSIARYVAGREGITEEQSQSWTSEQRELGEVGKFFFACIQFCFTATRI
jgi:ubiquinone/menaquinone biosynthesis C-methylase UbiE